MKIIIPIAPKPQSRPRFTKRRKTPYEQSEMTAYKQAVKLHAMAKKPVKIENKPIFVETCFYIYPPQYILKVKKNQEALENETIYCDKKPDIDNYFKAVTDALSGVLYHDDGQIAASASFKFYSLNPRTEIRVLELEKVKEQKHGK
jgi:Holliday junction resolvase RusA-like endonuclease